MKELLLAKSINTPPEKLAELAYHTNPVVRQAVAWNISTPKVTRIRLANDADDEVREIIATREDISPEELTRLSTDTCPDVRLSVAWNLKTPSVVLRQLSSTDSDEFVRDAAKNNPNHKENRTP